MRKINNLFKITINKLNVGITFQGIQIARYHIPRNLDDGGNVDSPVPNTT